MQISLRRGKCYNESVNSNTFVSLLKDRFKITNFTYVLCWCVCVCVRACLWVGGCVCVCLWGRPRARHLFVFSMGSTLHIEEGKCAQTLSCLMKYLFFTRMWHSEVKWSIVSSCCLHRRNLQSISCFKILFLK